MVPKTDLIGEGKRPSRVATNVKIMQRPSETSFGTTPQSVEVTGKTASVLWPAG